jgi:sec-independent protein translocase protein TatC
LLNEYTTEVITAFPNISETIGFLSSLILSFGIIFEYPLIIYLLSKLGLTSANFLASKRKYAVLICTICSAILTPTTDVISMMFMLIPLLFFYEIGVLIAKVTRKRN